MVRAILFLLIVSLALVQNAFAASPVTTIELGSGGWSVVTLVASGPYSDWWGTVYVNTTVPAGGDLLAAEPFSVGGSLEAIRHVGTAGSTHDVWTVANRSTLVFASGAAATVSVAWAPRTGATIGIDSITQGSGAVVALASSTSPLPSPTYARAVQRALPAGFAVAQVTDHRIEQLGMTDADLALPASTMHCTITATDAGVGPGVLGPDGSVGLSLFRTDIPSGTAYVSASSSGGPGFVEVAIAGVPVSAAQLGASLYRSTSWMSPGVGVTAGGSASSCQMGGS